MDTAAVHISLKRTKGNAALLAIVRVIHQGRVEWFRCSFHSATNPSYAHEQAFRHAQEKYGAVSTQGVLT